MIRLKIRELSAPADSNNIHNNQIIRVPESMRILFRIEIGTLLRFRTKDGGDVVLRVNKCFMHDIMHDALAARVTKYVYDQLELSDNKSDPSREEISIGCDPELFIVNENDGKKISASRYFVLAGAVGADNGLLELRPSPSTNEVDVVARLRGLLDYAYQLILNTNLYKINLIAASCFKGAAAGFHVHMGIPIEILQALHDYKNAFIQISRIMDYLVGLLAILPEGSTDVARRSNKYEQYGKPGDIRIDLKTLEYRVPGGILLKSPILSKGILALGAIVITDLVDKIKDITGNYACMDKLQDPNLSRVLYPSIPAPDVVYNAITSTSIMPAIRIMDEVLLEISRMRLFKDKKSHIEEYIEQIEPSWSKCDCTDKILFENWGLSYGSDRKQMGFLRAPHMSAYYAARG